MAKIEKDPMLELFMEESIQLITELSDIEEENREAGCYDQEGVKEIFRIFHTLKADATMMLFENIAETAREFEHIIYYYREQKNGIEDAAPFNQLLDEVIAFIRDELDIIEEQGTAPDSNEELVKKVKGFYGDLVKEEEPEENQKKQEKQVYYIASKPAEADEKTVGYTDDMAGSYVIEKKSGAERRKNLFSDKKEQEPEAGQEPAEPIKARKETKYNRKKHTLIGESDIISLKNIAEEMEVILKNYEERLQCVSIIALEDQDVKTLKSCNFRIKRWIQEIQAADFMGVALKMQNVAKEMMETLGKPVDLKITGEDTVIEKTNLEKISSAMIHLLRNAIDHGIEPAEERKRQGKEETGHVSITISKEKEKVHIAIQDDGAGLDRDRILEKAAEKGLLSKPAEEYTEEEAYGLLLVNGFSTKKEVTNYSGLGVGMDVVNKNVTDMGGEIRISSRLNEGTQVAIVL